MRRLVISALVTACLAIPGDPAKAGDATPDFTTRIQAAQQLANRINPLWIEAVIAAEDRNFRTRPIAASAITANAAQMLIHETRPDLARSKQIGMRMQTIISLSALAGREDIICLYLQLSHFGYGTIGHDAAARRFFRKGPNDLPLSDLAFLAGLMKAPDRFLNNPERALARRDEVLHGMHEAGAIDTPTLQAALAEPIPALR